MSFKELDWNKITQSIIIWAIIGIIGLSATFYIQTRIESQVNVEKEKIQTEQILELVKNENKILDKIDTNYNRNVKEHEEILFALNGVKEEVKILTYVISKSNNEINNEIKELKKLRINDANTNFADFMEDENQEGNQTFITAQDAF